MKWTNGRLKEKELLEYFYPDFFKKKGIIPKESDYEAFFNLSENGIEPKEKTEGYKALEESKRWRGIHMQMWEEGVLEGSVPYYSLLFDEGKMPRTIVEFIKKEMFKGIDSELIERIYKQEITIR